MKWKHIPRDTKNWEERPNQGLSSGRDTYITTSLSQVLDGSFLEWLKNDDANAENLNATGTVKSFKLGGKKYVVVIGKNKNHKNGIDNKAWIGAVLKGYKMISNKINEHYYPAKPPYELKIPKIYYHTSLKDSEITIIEWIDDLVEFQKISRSQVKIPQSHIDSLQTFIIDWYNAVRILAHEDTSKSEDTSIDDKYYAFTVSMPYGDVLVSDDFSSRDYHGGEGGENMQNMAYCIGEKGEPIVYITDGLCALSMEEK